MQTQGPCSYARDLVLFMVYNFVKVYGSVKTTPAIAAGVTKVKWTIEDIVAMADTTGMPA